ncbi:MAG: hypothetical protein EXX96DRAFT_557510 [Benjaminiella poitrasii]|nr:MAG: hypothetical protein EXX96DRAFT_557510 [Benjaminiella poitrasii]
MSTIPKDDPDDYFKELSVPDVRALEQRIRNAIETQKKELRVMVGEQYQDLISAADAIITMSKKAQAIQTNFKHMQTACDINTIKENAKKTLQLRDEQNNQAHLDTNRKYIYVIAALVKSLADVPEQIWHALENHRYLHASRLFILTKKVYEYLEEEKTKSTIDIEVAFPVIQRQWDSVSAFESQIIQRATHYLRISEQSSEHISEVFVGLMLLNGLTYKESLEKLLAMRFNVVQDIFQHYTKGLDNANHRISHQLREISLLVKRTLLQVFDIFVSKENNHVNTLLESYVDSFQKTFLIPSKSSHGNETPTQPAVTRLFSPSSNVHLIVRYLPESIQTYTPQFNPEPLLELKDIQQLIKTWIQDVESFLKEKLPELFLSINNQSELVQIRSKLWELLDEDENNSREKENKWQIAVYQLFQDHAYYMWNDLYRDIFNHQAKLMLDRDFEALTCQPETTVWPYIIDSESRSPKKSFSLTINIWPGSDVKHQNAFTLPNLSSSKEIEKFRTDLKETALDRTDILGYLQGKFDTALANIREDIQTHFVHYNNDHFHAKSDTDIIKVYFQDKCYESVVSYSNKLVSLIERVNEWKDQKTRGELAIFFGRLAKNIGFLSKELSKSLSLSTEAIPIFELRSNILKDPKYTEMQSNLLNVYHDAHESWLTWLRKEFTKKLKSTLLSTKWNDHCPALSIWETIEDNISLPTQATNAIVRNLFSICEEIQSINSCMLDQTIMIKLRKNILNSINDVFDLSNIKELEFTENGAVQLFFDYLFLSMVLKQETQLKSNSVIEFLEEKIDPINWASYEPHIKSCVEKFYIKHSLIFGVLTSATHETYERARKLMTSQQQGQYNILPLATQVTRFTLLPISHLSFSTNPVSLSVRSR